MKQFINSELARLQAEIISFVVGTVHLVSFCVKRICDLLIIFYG